MDERSEDHPTLAERLDQAARDGFHGESADPRVQGAPTTAMPNPMTAERRMGCLHKAVIMASDGESAEITVARAAAFSRFVETGAEA